MTVISEKEEKKIIGKFSLEKPLHKKILSLCEEKSVQDSIGMKVRDN